MILQRKKLNISVNKARLAQLCRKYGIDLVVLHGSYARGFFTKASDLDIALLGRQEKIKKHYFDIVAELSELFGDRLDTLVLNQAETMIVKQVVTYGIPLYEKTRGLFNDFKTTAISRYQDAAKFRKLEKFYLQHNIRRKRKNV